MLCGVRTIGSACAALTAVPSLPESMVRVLFWLVAGYIDR